MSWRIELLAAHHRRDGFDCGEPALNAFLQQQAGQLSKKGFGKTYVALAPDGVQVVGYVTLSAGYVKTQRLPSSRAFSSAGASAVASNVSMRGAARCSWERLAGFEGTRVAFQTKRLRK